MTGGMLRARPALPGWRLQFGMRGRKIVGYNQDGWVVIAWDSNGVGYMGQWIKLHPHRRGRQRAGKVAG